MSQDEAVRATNDDAASCKCAAVRLGYWKDPYIDFFAKPGDRKAPEINRGYYARVQGIQSLVLQFLEVTKNQCQIVNLGAGFDTQFWNLVDRSQVPRKFVETDFEMVTSRKVHCIRSKKKLLEKLSTPGAAEPTFTRSDVHSSVYHLIGVDLRKVDELLRKLDECGIDRARPTAFIAECVLVYMPSEASSALVAAIATNFQTALFINYEQVDMADRFGEVMIENLKVRGCALSGVNHCKNMDTQRARFLTNGWQEADGMDVLSVYRSLPQADVQRIEKLEFLDDQEMLKQLCEHYCIVWAFKDTTGKAGLKNISLKTSPLGQNSAQNH